MVLDNLNTHRMASLYETYPPSEARRVARRLEFHYTPKHGSWLIMAEIEFSVLARACLKAGPGLTQRPVAPETGVAGALAEQRLPHRRRFESNPVRRPHRTSQISWF